MVFLHGGVSNPYFNQSPDEILLDYLLEENHSFPEQAAANNFDLLFPVTDENFNWLDQPEKSFAILKNYIDSTSEKYSEIYISGFSDGATGSFKIFYNNSGFFDGLVMFNGYPQHANFYKTVDYSTVTDKKVIFFSTLKDKVIPYEFLLTEYSKQKEENPDTYFYLTEGDHSFINYTQQDFEELFAILTNKVSNTKTEPVQGFVKDDKLVTIYPFRKKIVRKYNYGKETYETNKLQQKKYSK